MRIDIKRKNKRNFVKARSFTVNQRLQADQIALLDEELIDIKKRSMVIFTVSGVVHGSVEGLEIMWGYGMDVQKRFSLQNNHIHVTSMDVIAKPERLRIAVVSNVDRQLVISDVKKGIIVITSDEEGWLSL